MPVWRGASGAPLIFNGSNVAYGPSMKNTLKWLWVVGSLLAAPALANRCLWNPSLNESHCCSSSQQAIYNSLLHEVECKDSQSGDSCVWDDVYNESSCCTTTQHAVWDELTHSIECYDL
jgi:hypothetical protein